MESLALLASSRGRVWEANTSVAGPSWPLVLLGHVPDRTSDTNQNKLHSFAEPQTEPNSKLLFLKLRTEPQFQKHQENSLNETLLQERYLKSFFSVRMLFLILLAKIAESVIQTVA